MKVILLQNIRGVGQIGDMKNVADGYARNFLFPRSMARLATVSALRDVDKLKKKREIILAAETEKATEAATKLQDGMIELVGKANPSGKLFASIGREDIVTKIKEVYGITLTEDMVNLSEHSGHLKQLGEHIVPLDLTGEIKVPLKVVIKAE